MKILLPWLLIVVLCAVAWDERRTANQWKVSAKFNQDTARGGLITTSNAVEVAERAIRDLTNAVHLAKAWQDVAIQCAKAHGIEIEVLGSTNVVITVPPKPFIKL